MRPTRRGYGVLAVVLTTVAVAAASGTQGRALNAVAAPALVAVLAGVVAVYRAGEPRVDRTRPRNGFPGESRTVELTVGGSGVGVVADAVGGGLSGGTTASRTLPAGVDYEVTYERRGVHCLGPATVRVRDALGLVERRHVVGETTEVVVYPSVYTVGDPGSFLRTAGVESDDRTEFDRVREYVPGDSLRDVNWKASAKYDDLLVAEYADPASSEGVTLAGACDPDHVEEMAAGVATLFVAGVREGVATKLVVPDGTLAHGHGEGHERRGLELLARTRGGEVAGDAWEGADLRVRADESGVTVTVDDRVHDLADLTAGRANPLLTEVPA